MESAHFVSCLVQVKGFDINVLFDYILMNKKQLYKNKFISLIPYKVEPIKILSENHQLYLAGMIEQSDSVLHRDMLQRIKDDSVSKLVEHKLTGKREVISNDIESLGYVLCYKFTEVEKRNAFW